MAERIEITTDRGESKVVSIEGAKVWLGSGEGVAIRLRAAGLAARHLCFVKTEHGYRVEPAEPGATVEVNGEDLFCKDLEVGDRIRVAGLVVRWMSSPPPARSPAATGQRPRSVLPPRDIAVGRVATVVDEDGESALVDEPPARVQRSLRARRRSSPVPMLVLFASIVLFLAVALKVGAGSTWPRSPQDLVDLAGQQLVNLNPEGALRTLEDALRDATGSTRDAALAMREQINQMLVAKVDQPKVEAARMSSDFLGQFERAYLRKDAPVLAVRELVRRCDRWLQTHGKVCETATAGQPLLREVQALRSRYVALARLGEPEGIEDLRFSIQVLMQLSTRDYLGAMQRFDEFQRANPGVAGVAAERQQVLAEGEAWLATKLTAVDAALDSSDGYRANLMLAPLEQWCALPEWRARLQQRRARIDALPK